MPRTLTKNCARYTRVLACASAGPGRSALCESRRLRSDPTQETTLRAYRQLWSRPSPLPWVWALPTVSPAGDGGAPGAPWFIARRSYLRPSATALHGYRQHLLSATSRREDKSDTEATLLCGAHTSIGVGDFDLGKAFPNTLTFSDSFSLCCFNIVGLRREGVRVERAEDRRPGSGLRAPRARGDRADPTARSARPRPPLLASRLSAHPPDAPENRRDHTHHKPVFPLQLFFVNSKL